MSEKQGDPTSMDKILPSKKPTALDLVVTCLVVALALLSALFTFRSNTSQIEVITESEHLTFDLDKDQTIALTSGGYSYTLVIKDGSAEITEADCPDGTCARTGAIGKRGGSIVCVPGGLLIKCVQRGTSDGNADFIIP